MMNSCFVKPDQSARGVQAAPGRVRYVSGARSPIGLIAEIGLPMLHALALHGGSLDAGGKSEEREEACCKAEGVHSISMRTAAVPHFSTSLRRRKGPPHRRRAVNSAYSPAPCGRGLGEG